jgi:hypothetical protein
MIQDKNWPASVPTLIVVSLDTGAEVVMVFCVAGAGAVAGAVSIVTAGTPGGGGSDCARTGDSAMKRATAANKYFMWRLPQKETAAASNQKQRPQHIVILAIVRI